MFTGKCSRHCSTPTINIIKVTVSMIWLSIIVIYKGELYWYILVWNFFMRQVTYIKIRNNLKIFVFKIYSLRLISERLPLYMSSHLSMNRFSQLLIQQKTGIVLQPSLTDPPLLFKPLTHNDPLVLRSTQFLAIWT